MYSCYGSEHYLNGLKLNSCFLCTFVNIHIHVYPHIYIYMNTDTHVCKIGHFYTSALGSGIQDTGSQMTLPGISLGTQSIDSATRKFGSLFA